MTITFNRGSFRASAAAAASAIALLGLVACSSAEPQPEEKPKTSTSTEAEPEAEATDDAAAGGQTKCTAEQVATISSASGVAVPDAALAAASGTFEPAGVIGDLPTTCVVSFGAAGMTAAYAVLPGGAATLTAVAANATAAGAEVTEAGGMVTASVDGVTVIGTSFTALTQETAGFESVDDLVVVVSTSMLG